MGKASRVQFSGAAISIAAGLAIFVASCIDLTVYPGSSGEGSSSSSVASSGSSSSSSSSSAGSSSSSSGGGSGTSSSSGMPPDTCGNGMVVSVEECDDGNIEPGDGCSPDCMIEHPEVCPGTTIPLTLGGTLVISGTNEGATDKCSSSMSGIPNSNCINGNFSGSDVVYQVIPDASGSLTVEFTAQYDSSWVHIRTMCPGMASDEVACRFTMGSGGKMTLTISVIKDVPYYVIADSFNNKSGAFTMKLSLQ